MPNLRDLIDNNGFNNLLDHAIQQATSIIDINSNTETMTNISFSDYKDNYQDIINSARSLKSMHIESCGQLLIFPLLKMVIKKMGYYDQLIVQNY